MFYLIFYFSSRQLSNNGLNDILAALNQLSFPTRFSKNSSQKFVFFKKIYKTEEKNIKYNIIMMNNRYSSWAISCMVEATLQNLHRIDVIWPVFKTIFTI